MREFFTRENIGRLLVAMGVTLLIVTLFGEYLDGLHCFLIGNLATWMCLAWGRI